jgi:hypothetical protein
MIESYYIGAYWGIRQESVEQCAHRLAGFLMCLAECDPCFAHWFKKGGSRNEALKEEIKPDIATLQTLLLAGQHRTDIGQKIMENLGFLIGLWNGASNDAESAGLMIQCGSYALRPGFNFCEIKMPYGETERERLLRVPVLEAIMKCAVSAWDPDWSVITSRQYQDMVPSRPSNAPLMGWFLYLSSRRGKVPSLPLPARVVSLGMQGSLVITTDERFTANNPRYVELAKRVTEELDRAGLLGPLA